MFRNIGKIELFGGVAVKNILLYTGWCACIGDWDGFAWLLISQLKDGQSFVFHFFLLWVAFDENSAVCMHPLVVNCLYKECDGVASPDHRFILLFCIVDH